MSEREKLGWDLDDVLIECQPKMHAFYNDAHGTKLNGHHYYSNDVKHFNAPDIETAIKRFNVYLESDEFLTQPPVEEAEFVLRSLSEVYDQYIVTGRSKRVAERVKRQLDIHLPGIFTEAIFTDYYPVDGHEPVTKAQVCLDYGISRFVEDHLSHTLAIAEAGIEVLLFGDYEWNRDDKLPPGVELPPNVIRVPDLNAVMGHLL